MNFQSLEEEGFLVKGLFDRVGWTIVVASGYLEDSLVVNRD